MKQTYSGGCHCCAVRYEADIDFSQGTVKCNCSICRKARTWLTAISRDDFRLISDADALSEYRFGAQRIQHVFCKHCGIRSFGRVNTPDGQQFVAVTVNCLDKMSDAELAALSVVYVDGLHDNFEAPPAESRFL